MRADPVPNTQIRAVCEAYKAAGLPPLLAAFMSLHELLSTPTHVTDEQGTKP